MPAPVLRSVQSSSKHVVYKIYLKKNPKGNLFKIKNTVLTDNF